MHWRCSRQSNQKRRNRFQHELSPTQRSERRYEPDRQQYSSRTPRRGSQPEQPTTRSKPVGDSVAAVANNHIDATNRVFGQYVAECNRTASQYTPEGQQARVLAFQNTEAFKGIDTHVAAVDNHIEQLEQQREAVRRSLAPEWGSAGEGDRARAWNRNKAIFDSQEGRQARG